MTPSAAATLAPHCEAPIAQTPGTHGMRAVLCRQSRYIRSWHDSSGTLHRACPKHLAQRTALYAPADAPWPEPGAFEDALAAEERLWAKVDRSGGPDACWPWTAGRFASGYGEIYVHGRGMWKTSRLVVELVVGRPLLPGEWALHSCDNPPCCNPAHLRIGTQADNQRDMVARGRQPSQMRRRDTCRRGHPMVGTNAIDHANGGRACRICRNARIRVRRAAQKGDPRWPGDLPVEVIDHPADATVESEYATYWTAGTGTR